MQEKLDKEEAEKGAIITQKEKHLREIEEFKINKEYLKAANEKLYKMVEDLKELTKKEIDRKDNEKLRATDKLKKEMLEKIQITKTGKVY